MIDRLACATLVLLLLPGGARAEHADVPMPAGWTVSKLPAPELDGRSVAGTRHRAMLMTAAGRPLAAVELTELPQTADGTGRLRAIMRDAVGQATADFKANDLADTCDDPAPIQVAGTPGLRTGCVIRRGEQAMVRQVIALWVTPKGLYTLSFSAAPSQFDAHLPEFEAALGAARTEP